MRRSTRTGSGRTTRAAQPASAAMPRADPSAPPAGPSRSSGTSPSGAPGTVGGRTPAARGLFSYEHADRHKKGMEDCAINLNIELTVMHNEAIFNLSAEHGIRLRLNCSIQAEGTFGTVKENCGHNRFQRRGLEKTPLEFGLVAPGFNLYKHRNKILHAKEAEKKAVCGLRATAAEKRVAHKKAESGSVSRAHASPSKAEFALGATCRVIHQLLFMILKSLTDCSGLFRRACEALSRNGRGHAAQ